MVFWIFSFVSQYLTDTYIWQLIIEINQPNNAIDGTQPDWPYILLPHFQEAWLSLAALGVPGECGRRC